MSYPDDSVYELRGIIKDVDEVLDANVSQLYKDQPLAQDWARVAKTTEEAGEAIDALIGWTAQNPRKGAYSNKEALLNELADVALCGLYAIQHFTKNPVITWEILMKRAGKHYERLLKNDA